MGLYGKKDIIGESLSAVRSKKVLPLITGKLVDLSCGDNELVRSYGNGVGVDIFDYGNVDCMVTDLSQLPFEDESVQTVSMLACINYYPNAEAVFNEVYRILSKNGRVIVTMPNYSVMKVWFRLSNPNAVNVDGELSADVHKIGMPSKEIIALFEQANIIVENKSYFLFGLNCLYVGVKK